MDKLQKKAEESAEKDNVSPFILPTPKDDEKIAQEVHEEIKAKVHAEDSKLISVFRKLLGISHSLASCFLAHNYTNFFHFQKLNLIC